jgi:two-component system alkaline phosphatase synthesis response regulator PhoP
VYPTESNALRKAQESDMRIMVVDDDEALVKSLGIHLRQMGHAVTPYRNPRKALERLHAGETPAVIIVDLIMPGMSGERFVSEARQDVGKRCRIILISGHTDVVDATALMSLPATAFLPKPLDLDQLAALLHEAGAVEPSGEEGGSSPIAGGEDHG